MTEATTSSYWISPTALYITLNANGDPNYIVGNTAAGAQILCYMRDINGLDYDAGHNYRRWPLLCSPTFFNTSTAKYVYAAIPRPNAPFEEAYIVFPNERLDIYGKNESETQIGSTDYYYIFLQGIISATNAGGTQMREWTHQVETGTLSSDEAIDAGGDQTWWRYLSVSDTVEFLKRITMSPASKFLNLVADLFTLNGKQLTEVADENTPVDSETAVVTPHYIGHHFLSKTEDDTAQGRIGFLQGLWVKALGLFGIDADGNAKLNNIEAGGDVSVGGNLGVKNIINAFTGIFQTLKSNNYTDDSMTGTGYRLTNDDGTGASQLVVDNIVARMKFIANILEVRKMTAMAGNYVFSPAASVIEEVDYFDEGGDLIGYEYVKEPWVLRNAPMFLKRVISNIGIFSTQRLIRVKPSDSDLGNAKFFRCWLKADDGSTQTINTWRTGMLARCQTFDAAQIEGGTQEGTYSEAGQTWTGKDVKNKLYWRAVKATGNSSNYTHHAEVLKDGKLHNYIDLANDIWYNRQNVEVPLYYPNASGTKCDIPSAGDHIVCYGDWKNIETSNFVTIETVGEDAPAIKEFMGVGYTDGESINWNLDSKMKTRISPKAGDRFVAPEFIIETGGTTVPVNAYMGIFVPGTSVAKVNQEWSYAGSTWVCLVDNTTTAPSESSQAWQKKVSQGSAPNVNILLNTVFENGLDFIHEKWEATEWGWLSMDSSQDTQYVEGHQSIRLVIPAGVGNETMLYQSVLGKLKPDTWYTISWYDFASKDYIFCIHNIINNVYTNLYADGKVIVDGVEYSGTNDHNDVPITGAWEGKRHYITFKTKPVVEGESPISTTNLNLGWYFYNDSGSAAQNFVLCMPKLEEGQFATSYVANDDDYTAYAFRTIPESVIVTEKRANSTVSYEYPARIQVKANIGGTDSNVTISNVTSDCLTVAKVTESGEDKISISGVATDYQYGHTYAAATQGTIGVTGTCNGKSFSLSISVYFNRLGSMAIIVQGDSVKEVAQKTGFYDSERGVDQLDLMGQYVRSSEENVSILTKKVNNGKNLLSGVLTGTGWGSSHSGLSDAHSPIVVDESYYMSVKPNQGDYQLVSPSFNITSGEKITFSFEVAISGSINVHFVPSSGTETVVAATGGANARRSATYKPSITGTCRILIDSVSGSFRYPQVETGETATAFEANTTEVSSQIKQTADNIDLSITNKLGQTGINIQGSNRTIDITAAKVQIGNDQTATVFEGGKIKANLLEVDTIMSEGDGIYTNIQPGQFSLGVIENSVRQTAFDLAVDENGNAVLRYYDKNGNLIGVIDSSFFNSEAIGNTWNPVRLKKVNNSTVLNEPTYASVRTIVKNSLLPVQTAYKFSEGYTKSGTGQQIVKTYNVSQNQSPSQFNNLYLDAQYTTAQLRAALIGTPSDTYFTDGTYVAENAIPMSDISYQSEEPKFFYQLYIISSGVFSFGYSAYAQPGDDVEA